MKKVLLTLVFALAINLMGAQNEKIENKATDYNRWSLEFGGGFNKPARPLTTGYYTSVVSPYTVEVGARYMFNNKFGLKTDFGFNSFTGYNNSLNFDSKYYSVNVQGVANLGRIMSFETWTKSIGLLGHAGFGLSFLERKEPTYLKDRIGNFMAGVTGQIKLSNRVALTGDFSTIINARQHVTFDGFSPVNRRGFNGYMFTGTAGITVYLGKNAKHADWVNDYEDKFSAIDKKFTDIDNKLMDTDKDGVADYLDEEPNTAQGNMVDAKGKSIDKNRIGVPDDTEDFITKNYANNTTNSSVLSNNELITSLINGGNIAVYFDFDKSQPTNVSTEGIDFMLTYLRNNPSATIDIYGHADEIGRTEYNDKLSNARAASVKNTLVKANVEASRLNIIAAGEDTSVDVDSENARKLVRRVTFRVK
jgi:OOP family OmpA-OmpF porin